MKMKMRIWKSKALFTLERRVYFVYSRQVFGLDHVKRLSSSPLLWSSMSSLGLGSIWCGYVLFIKETRLASCVFVLAAC
jgi:hypothetical protein